MRRTRTTRRQPAPEPAADAATRPASAAEELAAHLRGVIADAEGELARLGRYPQAWQEVRVYVHLTRPLGTAPSFAWGPTAEALLGPIAMRSDGLIPTRKMRAVQAITRRVKRCGRCQRAIAAVPDVAVESAMIARARDHHPVLFREYLREVTQRVPAVLREAPAAAAALRAATAAAALEHLDSPMACFAAGAYLEQHRMLAWTVQTLLPRASARARRRFEEGIARGHFPELEHVARHRVRSEAAKQQQAERATREEPVREAVRREHRRLRKAGVRVTAAAHRIVEDLDIRQRIQAVAHDHSVKPWQGDFYSFAAVRKIVGV